MGIKPDISFHNNNMPLQCCIMAERSQVALRWLYAILGMPTPLKGLVWNLEYKNIEIYPSDFPGRQDYPLILEKERFWNVPTEQETEFPVYIYSILFSVLSSVWSVAPCSWISKLIEMTIKVSWIWLDFSDTSKEKLLKMKRNLSSSWWSRCLGL